MKTYNEHKTITGLILASVAILLISQSTQASDQRVPPIPHEVLCEMSGHDANTPENVSCIALLDAFPPLQSTSKFHQNAVVRKIEKGTGNFEAECILLGGVREMVDCSTVRNTFEVNKSEIKDKSPDGTLTEDGKSFDTAIFFESVTDMSEYIFLEYVYLDKNGLNSLGQNLFYKDGKKYDVHETEIGKIYFRLP
jgi:hypothetical protein